MDILHDENPQPPIQAVSGAHVDDPEVPFTTAEEHRTNRPARLVHLDRPEILAIHGDELEAARHNGGG